MPKLFGGSSSSDFHNHGLRELVPDRSDVAERQGRRPIDIIFVHGLTGTWDNTWTGRTPDGQQVLWPKELLKEQFPNARIFSFGYDANAVNLTHRVSTQSVTKHATDLLLELETFRREAWVEQRKVVFVAHSLGGLVVQKMLSLSQTSHQTHLQRIESLTLGAVFFGTPMLGADLHAWASIGTGLSSILKQTNRDIVDILDPNSSMAESIRLDITNLVERRAHTKNPINIACFYECLPVHGYGKVVVNDKSAIWPPHYNKGIQADHMNMTKFATAQEGGYKAFVGEVGRWIDEDTGERTRPSEFLPRLDFAERTVRQQQIDNADARESTLDWIWSEGHESRSSFAQWLLNGQAVFWIQGKPGSGKSTLMSYLEKASGSWQIHSRSDSRWSTIRFFFDFRAHDGLANNLEGFLRSLLFQILKQNPSSEDEVHRLEEQFGDYKPATWTSSALKEAFVKVLRQITVNMCILVDGLDEFSGNMHELMTLFHKLPSKTNTGHLVKICLASRPHPVIAMALGDWPGLQMQAHNEKAIEQYASTTMEDLGVAANERRRFSADIAKKAEGVFLWARFAVKEIINGHAEGEDMNELYQRLEALPSDMEELYAYIFKRMNSKDHDEAQLMFQLVCFAQETYDVDSINLRQLKEAVAIAQNNISGFGQHDSVEGLERFRKRVKAKSGGLLEEIFYERNFEAEDKFYGNLEDSDDSQASDAANERARENYNKNGGTLKLIHRTAESYLERQGWFLGLRSPQYPSPHALWLHVCCKSIQSDLGSREFQLRNPKSTRLKFGSTKSSIFEYASRTIFIHARLMEYKYQESSFPFLETISPKLLRHLRKLYRPMLPWETIWIGYRIYSDTVDQAFDRQPWQITVEQKLPLSLRDAVLRNCYTCPSDGEDISIALITFAYGNELYGHGQEVQEFLAQQLLSYLIQFGAVVRERHLIECLYGGRADSLRILFASWPKKELQLRVHHCPLSMAGSERFSNMKEDCTCIGESVGILYRLVQGKSMTDFEAKLVLLLERGEILNKICGPAGTALHAFMINLYQGFSTQGIRVVLNHGADPNISGPRGTSLQLAWRMFRSLSTIDGIKYLVLSSFQEIMTLLLDYGANASWVEPNGLSIDRRVIEAWCAMSREELIARWEDDDYPYCISDWDNYEFPLYRRQTKRKILSPNDCHTLDARMQYLDDIFHRPTAQERSLV